MFRELGFRFRVEGLELGAQKQGTRRDSFPEVSFCRFIGIGRGPGEEVGNWSLRLAPKLRRNPDRKWSAVFFPPSVAEGFPF